MISGLARYLRKCSFFLVHYDDLIREVLTEWRHKFAERKRGGETELGFALHERKSGVGD